MKTIWLIEDDKLSAELWLDHIHELAVCQWFDCAFVACQSVGSPDSIIFDVGSTSLQYSLEQYLSIFHQLRDKHTCWIYLVSGIPSISEMVMEELDDDLAVSLTGRGLVSGFLEHWKKYNG